MDNERYRKGDCVYVCSEQSDDWIAEIQEIRAQVNLTKKLGEHFIIGERCWSLQAVLYITRIPEMFG